MAQSEFETVQALERQVARRAFLIAVGFMAAVAAVNATTILMEAARSGDAIHPAVPWINEFTSVAVLLALFPAVAWFAARVPITAETWRSAVPLHALASVAYSALHVAGMVGLRKLVYGMMGRPYEFFDAPLRDAVYEYRKDALTYAIFLLVLHLVRSIAEHRRELEAARADARQTGRLTLKCGGRTIFLTAEAVDWAEAAGNYVEIRSRGGKHLARMSLRALEEQLRAAGVEIAQVHRSRLVNLRRVAEIEPSGDGDFHIRLEDGTRIRGSRRYRGGLPSAAAGIAPPSTSSAIS